MNRLRALVCTLFAALPISLSALTWTDDKGVVWSYTVSNGTATITGIPEDTVSAVTVPNALPNGEVLCPVTAIGRYAFRHRSSLRSVVIPEGVTLIGEGAFQGCGRLTLVTIPTSVTSIETWAFGDCTFLHSVTIPEGVTSIAEMTFLNCLELRSVTIPASVTSIGDRAFESCMFLTSVAIPEGVTSIGRRAFQNCSNLTSITLPDSVTSIGDDAFANCTSLPTDVNGIRYESLEKKVLIVAPESLTGAFVIPATVQFILNEAFINCSSLTSVTIPEGVTSIGKAAFESCYSLTSIVIPEGVTAIGNYAFSSCSALTSVDIPSSVTSIGDSAFSGCSALTSVVIPEGVPVIGDSAFSGCSSLTSVNIPSSVTTIGYAAFYGCSALTSVVIPEGVTSIGERAFRDTQCKLVFLGRPPREGLSEIRVSPWGDWIVYPEEYAAEWEHALQVAQYSVGSSTQAAVTATAVMTTPKTMKVTYQVSSGFSRAKVRAVAWKDGVRSFANIIPVKTAADDSPEAVPNGETVATGVKHTFIWQVSADWNIDLAKVAVEVLAEDAGLLPQNLVTIPAIATHAKITITTNAPTTEQLFNALVWYYVNRDSALTVSNGVVKINGTQVASGASLTAWGCNNTTLLNYLYGKMGYKVLTGADLTYAREATEIEFANSGLNQVSIKISEE